MRTTVFAAIALCVGCGETGEMSKATIAPWHMWGTQEIVDVTSAGASGRGQTLQLVKINYGRPETWRFFLYAQTLDGDANAGGSLIVSFPTTIGLGRSQVTAPLGVFNFVWPAAFPKTVKFASASLGPLVDDAQPTIPNLVETVVAEDIQVQAQVVLVAPAGKVAKVQVGAFFAPEGHVRPEWFKGGDYPGGENKGH